MQGRNEGQSFTLIADCTEFTFQALSMLLRVFRANIHIKFFFNYQVLGSGCVWLGRKQNFIQIQMFA